jgi:uncharacterized protein
MSLKEKITEDMKNAMRAKETAKLGTIRLLTAAMKQKEVDERVELTDTQILAIIEKMIKQRKDSIGQFEAGGRQDLADIEKAELAILSAYMPASLSDAEVQAEVAAAVAATGAAGPQDMGKVMAILKPKLACSSLHSSLCGFLSPCQSKKSINFYPAKLTGRATRKA